MRLSGVLLALGLAAWLPAQPPTAGTCTIFPADNIWNTPVDTLPLSPNSATYVNTIGASSPTHADFGSGLYGGGPIGIPWITVPGTQAKYPVKFDYADESDPGPYAIPLSAPIEGGSASTGDRHAIAIDTDNCILYELYSAYPQAASWQAGSGVIFDLKSNALRPAGWTSADAAGLPIQPGLARYDEVAAGEIRHALRFTVPHTQKAYIWPARHYASSLTGAQYPPMGQRFRLKANFDISGFPADVQVILRALKKYGMILADNGSPWFISGAPDDRWNNDNLSTMRKIAGSAYEAVDESSLMIDPNSGQARQSGVSVTVAPATATVLAKGSRQFTAAVQGASDSAVTWSVNGLIGGSALTGTIDANGLYVAPAEAPDGAVVVRATSVAAPTATGSASLVIRDWLPRRRLF
ncbi:MAG TPA: hypothetical protein VKT49_07120 [Bryobacteraceae bacterium]|nr:hypothetical protein [Bryobacteraceae bacterium]